MSATTTRSQPLVMHVVESLGGGVLSAVRDYLASTPQYDHVVLARARPGHDTGEHFDGLAREIQVADGRLDRAVSLVSRSYRRLQPDVVHAHSSFGGVWARLARVPADRIVYTPHCYAFERRDLPAAHRGILWGAERLLARRTAAVAAVSPREAGLARKLNGAVQAAHVPNVARVPDPGAAARRDDEPTLTVVAAGRLCEQKDPGFFAEAVRHARSSGVPLRWKWLGGGSAEDERALRDEGVHVSGWIPRRQLLRELGEADVYVHTAAWEGAPITVLEAAALDVPIVARGIPALRSLGLQNLVSTPAELASAVHAMVDEDARRRSTAESRELTSRHRPDQQARALEQTYRTILHGRKRVPDRAPEVVATW